MCYAHPWASGGPGSCSDNSGGGGDDNDNDDGDDPDSYPREDTLLHFDFNLGFDFVLCGFDLVV